MVQCPRSLRFASLSGLTALSLILASAAHADAPLSYLTAHGARAHPINTLLWGVIAISLAVLVMALVLVPLSTFRGRSMPGHALPGELPVEAARGGMSWIVLGVGVSALVLLGVTIWTVVTLAAVSPVPPRGAKLALEVVGHQWWWEVRYLSNEPDRQFQTADEIHVPVGEPVVVKLRTADVIHSFWIPALTGKTDLIPGQTNISWFSADRPGVYRGQCTEYCGQQHAHMGLEVFAEPNDAFASWQNHQLQPAAAKSEAARRGLAVFMTKCAACHTVRGTPAGGVLGPDLSHLMTRHRLAAGTLPNNPGYLSAWISDPQHVKPGALMPRLDLSGPELAQLRDFIEQLQ